MVLIYIYIYIYICTTFYHLDSVVEILSSFVLNLLLGSPPYFHF